MKWKVCSDRRSGEAACLIPETKPPIGAGLRLPVRSRIIAGRFILTHVKRPVAMDNDPAQVGSKPSGMSVDS
ncbi:MAG: hypothetical protein F4X92_08725 [Gammaproteobacteria bacterium]|nr:hypothetical protein [Gammaproteobacteria bacterium]